MVSVLQESLTLTLLMNVASFSTVGSTRALFLQGDWGVSLVLPPRPFPGVCSFLFHWSVSLLQPSSLLSRGSPSHLPLCILLLIGFLKLSSFLQIDIHVLEYPAFWNPFIPIFIPTTVMYKVFHLFILYGNFYTLCFIKKRPMEAQHSLTLLELRLRVLLRHHF